MPASLDLSLLVAAQTLFMVLPLAGLYGMRDGHPTRVTLPKAVIVSCAIVAFGILVAMFYITPEGKPPNWVGVGVCSGNLALRLIEAARCLQLHHAAAAQGLEHDPLIAKGRPGPGPGPSRGLGQSSVQCE